MGKRNWTEGYASKEEALKGIAKTKMHGIPGYSERYVVSGPEEKNTTTGTKAWFVKFEEYYG